MMNNKPIGIFDSGVGGLSIWRELIKELPGESTIYFADTINCPYGPRKIEEIEHLAEKAVKFLISQNVKLILIACNTITVSVIDKLRKQFQIPFVGVEPATKVAAEKTVSGNIGILATKGTFSGNLYNETKNKFANDKNVFIQIGEGLVEMVENNTINEDESIKLLNKYVSYFSENNIDQVALGCTHYPFLKPKLEELSDNKINYIDPAEAVINQLTRVLKHNNLVSNTQTEPIHKIYSSGKIIDLEQLIPEIKKVKHEIFTEEKI